MCLMSAEHSFAEVSAFAALPLFWVPSAVLITPYSTSKITNMYHAFTCKQPASTQAMSPLCR